MLIANSASFILLLWCFPGSSFFADQFQFDGSKISEDHLTGLVSPDAFDKIPIN